MSQPSPPATSESQPERPPVPSTVKAAARLMYTGAAVMVASAVLLLLNLHALRDALAHSTGGQHDTPAQLHTLEVQYAAYNVISDVLFAAVWLWMAWVNRRGRRWGRNVASVLFGLSTLSLVSAAAQGGALAPLVIVPWAVGLGALIFLWRKPSTEYYEAMSRD
jgi:hypothetical protein